MRGAGFAVYKGLQKPLVYQGFSGRFIYWAVGSLLAGLVLGAVVMAALNMLLGLLVLVAVCGGGILYTLGRQKRGLYQKSRAWGIYHLKPRFNPRIYDKARRVSAALYGHG